MTKRALRVWTLVFFMTAASSLGSAKDETSSAFALRYGQSLYDESELLIGGQKKEVPFAWYAWLVKTGPSLTLIDCGFLDAVLASRFAVSPWTTVKTVLQNTGFSASDVGDIVLTHGHWDHMGGISDFPKARLWMARSEFQAMQRSVNQNRPWAAGYRWEDLEKLKQAAKEGRLHLIKKEIKLKGGLRLKPVGGHTPGCLAVTLDAPNKPRVVWASDNAYLYANLDEDRPQPGGSTPERKKILVSLKKMKGGTGILVPGHDPLTAQKFPQAAENVFALYPLNPDPAAAQLPAPLPKKSGAQTEDN